MAARQQRRQQRRQRHVAEEVRRNNSVFRKVGGVDATEAIDQEADGAVDRAGALDEGDDQRFEARVERR